MSEDGERIARLEQWSDSHGAECGTRYDELLRRLDTIRTDMADDRKEMRETVRRNHKRMDQHARAAALGCFVIGTSLIGWMATVLWGKAG